MTKKIILLLILTGSAFAIFSFRDFFASKKINVPTGIIENKQNDNEDAAAITTLAENLKVPWALDFLPDGKIIFTERDGNIKTLDSSGNIAQIDSISVNQNQESGLQGIAVDPSYNSNNFIYVYYTYSSENNDSLNRVARLTFKNNSLTDEKIIVDKIPGAIYHDGGRIKFGPDGYLYITTGDANVPSRAQDKNSLAGKILRVTKDGDLAPNNPFSNNTFSYGHRNPQGITWDDSGNLWETEHGRSGALSGYDEVNKIEAGKNYGWPEIQGSEARNGMVTPVLNSGATTTWAPAGAAYYNGSIFFGGLRGQTLYQYNINSKTLVEHLKQKIGRIREVVLHNGLLYITTSNRDGRGEPSSTDDKILQINPERLNELD